MLEQALAPCTFFRKVRKMSRQYKGILKERKPWVNCTLAAVVAGLMCIQFVRGNFLTVLFGVVVILACFYKKEYIINEEGVDIQSSLFGKITHNLWAWEEITTLHTDHKRANPNTMLHIGKDITTRSFTMTPEDCQAAVELAREMNPAIYIENPTPEEEAQREQEILHRREVERAQKKAMKKARKNH